MMTTTSKMYCCSKKSTLSSKFPSLPQIYSLLFVLLALFHLQHSSRICVVYSFEEIKLGALVIDDRHQYIWQKNIDSINDDKTILLNTKLKLIIEKIDSENSYEVSNAVCRLLSQKIWALFGPHSVQLTPMLQSATSYYKIPLILTSWQPQIVLKNKTNYNSIKISDDSEFQDDIESRHATPASSATTSAKIRGKRYDYDEKYDSIIDNVALSRNALYALNQIAMYNYTVNLYPQSDQLSQAYLDLIKYKQWRSFTLVYDTAENFIRIKDILQASFGDTSIGIHRLNDYKLFSGSGIEELTQAPSSMMVQSMQARQTSMPPPESQRGQDSEANEMYLLGVEERCSFDSDEPRNIAYGKLMKDLRIKRAENIVLSLPLKKVCKLLKEAKHEHLLTIYNDYIIANLDSHLLNVHQLLYSSAQSNTQTNISGYSLLDPSGQQTDFTVSKKWLGKKPSSKPKKLMSSEYAVMSDAVTLVAHSIDEIINLRSSESRLTIQEPNVDCKSSESWESGDILMQYLKEIPRSGGYTGDLRFDKFGQRIDFELDYIMHKNSSFRKVGLWNATSKLRDLARTEEDFGLQALKNKTLKVVVSITEPYVMYRSNHTERIGNDKYHGYCIDLLNKLARKLQFSYVVYESPDGQYGKIQNGSWTGMIKELLDGKADLAIVDLTITKERQSAVDFTHPFMTLGIAIMFKKPKVEKAELFSFLMPFSTEVWLSMGSASFAFVLAMWSISRLSPLEWTNPHPCDDGIGEQDYENELHSIGASMWFITGSLMQQGSDLAPRSTSVRALASIWFFFTLILVSSYTANFAAFLTASRMQSPIESAEDLAKQTKIDYGCKKDGSTHSFFASSNHSTYRRMWNFMESRKHQGVFPPDNTKGKQMVKKGNFAFLMESTSIEYEAQRDCEITQIGGLLDHKGYGIALRKRSPFRQTLSKTIVELNEAGELQDLKHRWWNNDAMSCAEEKDSASATSELGIDKVGGVFVLLGLGICVSSLAVVLEFVWKSLKVAKDERKPVRYMLWNEVKRIFMCGPSKRSNTSSSIVAI